MRKAERVRLFLVHLAHAPPAADHDEAYALIAATLTSVEDEHSGVPSNPATWKSDGRLYPPQADNASHSKEYPKVTCYRSVDHWTYIAPNGAFRIEAIALRKTMIDRPGRDGRTVAAFASPLQLERMIDLISRKKHITSMEYPEQIQQFLGALTEQLGQVSRHLEETRAGHWWIDLRSRRHLAVEWRPGLGFGLSDRPSHYGEGPAEIFISPERAARRVAQILAPKRIGRPVGLAAVRELYGMTQQELARKLAKGQPAISQIERGRDSKLETIGEFIRGLGGQMEVRAVFRDGSLPISLTQPRKRKNSIAPARAVRAQRSAAAARAGRALARI